MAKALLDENQKDQIESRWAKGESQQSLANAFDVSRRTISRVLQETGRIEPDGLHHKIRRNGKNIFTADEQTCLDLLKTHKIDSQRLEQILTSPALTVGNMVKAVAGFNDSTTVNFLTAVRNQRNQNGTTQ